MNPKGNNWMPPVAMPSMPGMGFGVVMPQPGVAASFGNRVQQAASGAQPVINNANMLSNPSWQSQQYMKGRGDGTSTIYSQQYLPGQHIQQPQQQSQQLQQQWYMAQNKTLEEQKLMYDKMMKQKHFDEQKQRLKDFNASKTKAPFTADIMIQNILGKEQPTKQKSEKKDNREFPSSNMTNFRTECMGPPATAVIPHQNALQHSNNYYSHCNPQQSQSYSNTLQPSLVVNKHKKDKDLPILTVCLAQDATSPSNVKQISNFNSIPTIPSTHCVVSSNGSRDRQNLSLHPRTPLKLPEWLKNTSKIPEVYGKASGLVETSEGWVDTSRAYMLLMRTNLAPQLLGVLWEMVNRSCPGRLQISEFHALLALAALVQSGRAFSNADVLISLETPVYPLIDHPVLLPLSQTEIEKCQLQEKCQDLNINNLPVSSETNESSLNKTSPTEEFADFVSAATVMPKIISKPTSEEENLMQKLSAGDDKEIISSKSKNVSCLSKLVEPSSASKMHTSIHVNHTIHSTTGQRHLKSFDQEKVLNLPILGNSPLNHAKPIEELTDDFDDFQSAPSAPPTFDKVVLNVNKTIEVDVVMDKDKYAAFRELAMDEFTSQEEGEDIDESFGEFCSSLPPSNSQPNSIETSVGFAHQDNVKTNFLSVHNVSHINTVTNTQNLFADTSTMDTFGALESIQKSNNFSVDASSSSGSSYVTANVSADTSNDADDDFGDFVGPADNLKEAALHSAINYVGTSDAQAETQSVASLELPGLEITVNLSPVDNFFSSSTSNARVEESTSQSEVTSNKNEDLKQDFDTLSFEESDLEFKSNDINNSQGLVDVISSLDAFPLADKYSIIREEDSKVGFDDPHIESWKKCLEGCKHLLEEGIEILGKISEDTTLFDQVLATSQMQDYISNLTEVWEVSWRIKLSSEKISATTSVKDLLSSIKELRSSIIKLAKTELLEKEECDEMKLQCEDGICGLCLLNGGASLFYGGQSYHPPCANLWLNVVDLTLPSLNSARGGLL